MRATLLRRCLEEQIDRLRAEAWSADRLALLPGGYDVESGGRLLHVELSVLERKGSEVRIGVSIDDGSLFRTLCPVSASFCVKLESFVRGREPMSATVS